MPLWATLVGGFVLFLMVVFAVIGSAVVFTWILRVLGAA